MLLANKRFLCAIAGYCFLVAAGGCRFHRTGRGFIVRSQWALESENIPRLSFGAEQGEDPAIEQFSAKPELLRWRIRRRGYRLASRLFGRGEFADQDNLRHLAKTETPEPVGSVLDTPQTKDIGASRTHHAVLQLPDSVLLQPEPRRPDLVID